MPSHCIRCNCPLLLLDGERRRVCARCTKTRKRPTVTTCKPQDKSRKNRAYYDKHREQVLARSARRYQQQRERILGVSRAYYLAHREEILIKSRQRRAAKREQGHA